MKRYVVAAYIKKTVHSVLYVYALWNREYRMLKQWGIFAGLSCGQLWLSQLCVRLYSPCWPCWPSGVKSQRTGHQLCRTQVGGWSALANRGKGHFLTVTMARSPALWLSWWPGHQLCGCHNGQVTSFVAVMMAGSPALWLSQWPGHQLCGCHDGRVTSFVAVMMARSPALWLSWWPGHQLCGCHNGQVTSFVAVMMDGSPALWLSWWPGHQLCGCHDGQVTSFVTCNLEVEVP